MKYKTVRLLNNVMKFPCTAVECNVYCMLD